MKTKSLLIVGLTLVLASCAPASVSTPTETVAKAEPTDVITSKIDQNTAVEVAQKSCASSGATQIEEPQEKQATLMSLTDGYKKMRESTVAYSISLAGNAVWFVQLQGSWQGVGHPKGTVTPTPSEVPMIWDICEVLVDAQTGKAVAEQLRWNIPSQ